jgi:beta-glucanase (GH16 family)
MIFERRLGLAGSVGACWLTSVSCQVESTADATPPPASSAEMRSGAARLPNRGSGAPPPVLPGAAYAIDATELVENGDFAAGVEGWLAAGAPAEAVPSELRVGGNSLLVHSATTRKWVAGTLTPGRSYRLEFMARSPDAREGTVAVKFRELHNNTIRTFEERVASPTFRRYSVEFTAPTFTGLSELALAPGGGGMMVDSASVRMIAALPETEPVVSWAGSFVPSGYALVFNDEFNGTELDRRKWFTKYIYGSETLDRLNDENERYADDDEHHRVSGGVLRLVATRKTLTQFNGVNYDSALIRSDWTVRYGFLEARVKMPAGLGVFPAFWLNSDVSETGRLTWPPEVDIFEFVNNGKDDRSNMLHMALGSAIPAGHFSYVDHSFSTSNNDYFAPFAFGDGWHTIGAEWTPESVTTYVDGLKVFTKEFQWVYKDGTPAGPAHVILNLAIGGHWAGRYGIDDSAFPQALQVDWVRVYQKAK